MALALATTFMFAFDKADGLEFDRGVTSHPHANLNM